MQPGAIAQGPFQARIYSPRDTKRHGLPRGCPFAASAGPAVCDRLLALDMLRSSFESECKGANVFAIRMIQIVAVALIVAACSCTPDNEPVQPEEKVGQQAPVAGHELANRGARPFPRLQNGVKPVAI